MSSVDLVKCSVLSLAKLQTINLKLLSNKSFKKVLQRSDSSKEPYESPIIVCNHELKNESSFIFWCQFER